MIHISQHIVSSLVTAASRRCSGKVCECVCVGVTEWHRWGGGYRADQSRAINTVRRGVGGESRMLSWPFLLPFIHVSKEHAQCIMLAVIAIVRTMYV